jgi:potassium-transporting ATPase KdpC subunit
VRFFFLLRQSTVLLALLAVLTGLIYPLSITGIASAVFPRQAQGSLIVVNGKILGSQLIGQPFESPKYFWSRPSATQPFPYNAASSGGSNLGPSNPALLQAVQARLATLHTADPGNQLAVPVDLVTASASGLDPDISVAAARYQAGRVAAARNLPLVQVDQLIDTYTENPQFGLLGEPRVNVLELNLALDGIK